VHAFTIDTTILVSTFNLSNVIRRPETPAVYRSSGGRSNVVLRTYFGTYGQEARPKSAKCAETALARADIVRVAGR
jgi:hypothetical protein